MNKNYCLLLLLLLAGNAAASEFVTGGAIPDAWVIDNLKQLADDADAAQITRFRARLGCWNENTDNQAVVACFDGSGGVVRYGQARLRDVVTEPVLVNGPEKGY